MTKCKHLQGDFIHGMWICASCYTLTEGRPKRYGLTGHGGNPQEIVWQASTATDQRGTMLGEFLLWMIRELRRRSLWRISIDDARRQCIAALKDHGEPFGSSNALWTEPGAKDLVDEYICSYWESLSNGGKQ